MINLNKVDKIFSLIIFGVILILLISICCISQFYYKRNMEYILIAKVISAEACSEKEIGMYGVACTISNRMKQKNMTALEVVTEKNQYYGLNNKNRDKIFSNPCCYQTSMLLAKNLNNLVDITNGSIYFKTKEEQLQSWHKEKTITLGKLEFYK
ncbi:MAG: cell wall hydrolase [Novosphingobium sp.]|nr:cell wall hydrolase [Novosphingobium sp.]